MADAGLRRRAVLAAGALVTPRDPELSAGLVCVEVAGHDPADVVEHLLGERIVASVTPYREAYVRFGTSIVTTPEQVDAAVEAVAGLAGERDGMSELGARLI
ncbi:hypothetical protein [Jiangella endophytica]|uniref:hypothetical protein n=1 Tax=Jiangella endophytica TaxID=1623398 RepID=UPI000E35603A|nr:hypothetical protein [Jiangella endophytica]